jgi:toxin ParE1/3/4
VASVHWTVGARRDLEEIVEYIRRDSPTSATALAERILARARTLRRYPRLGRVVPEYRDEAVRELIVGDYRVVYRLLDRRLDILAVVHGSRDLLGRLSREPWDLG